MVLPLATFRQTSPVVHALEASIWAIVMEILRYTATYLHLARKAIAERATELPTRAGTTDPKSGGLATASSYRSLTAARRHIRPTSAKPNFQRTKDAVARLLISWISIKAPIERLRGSTLAM